MLNRRSWPLPLNFKPQLFACHCQNDKTKIYKALTSSRRIFYKIYNFKIGRPRHGQLKLLDFCHSNVRRTTNAVLAQRRWLTFPYHSANFTFRTKNVGILWKPKKCLIQIKFDKKLLAKFHFSLKTFSFAGKDSQVNIMVNTCLNSSQERKPSRSRSNFLNANSTCKVFFFKTQPVMFCSSKPAKLASVKRYSWYDIALAIPPHWAI